MSNTEVVELASRLRSLDCTWEWDTSPSGRRPSSFARRSMMIRPRWDVLDTGFEETGRAATRQEKARREETTDRVRLRLTDYRGQWDQALDAFARMATALSDALGEPAVRVPGDPAEIHWEMATEITLVLENTGTSVYLDLATNKRLAFDEEVRRLDEDEEGLL
ncbi:DUF6301 family protein [Streptomyces sp. NPDC051561]|uniref:DUF6301 family protein n=1 Tax=Streptomyces sp. NPDC051561 TaxID=3365658 RepID=UPI0037977446